LEDITIIYGIARDVPSVSRYSFSFSIGQPPVSVSMNVFGNPPFNSNEYIAVAVQRGIVGTGFVALAYQRVGQRAPPHMASPVPGVIAIAVAVAGVSTWARASGPANQLIWISLTAVFVGVASASRLRGMWKAKYLLSNWDPP
jgi:hypothetical protein